MTTSTNEEMELIIVRHGETEWTLSHRHTGREDLPLTAHGRRQSSSLGPMLKRVLHNRTAAVHSSPLRRALETMELALPGVEYRIEPLLREYDYGIYEGQTFEQIRAVRPDWDIWRDGCPGGEQTNEVALRADRFLAEHVDNATQPVVVFTHGHFLRILAARALGLEAESGSIFSSSPATVSIMQEHHGIRCVELWNASVDTIAAERGDL